jgi:hypothetical protein
MTLKAKYRLFQFKNVHISLYLIFNPEESSCSSHKVKISQKPTLLLVEFFKGSAVVRGWDPHPNLPVGYLLNLEINAKLTSFFLRAF